MSTAKHCKHWFIQSATRHHTTLKSTRRRDLSTVTSVVASYGALHGKGCVVKNVASFATKSAKT